MLVLNRSNLNTSQITKYKAIILSYTFLSIYGLPFCLSYYNMIKNIAAEIKVALETNDLQSTATLAIINNFPHLIIKSTLEKELLIIKKNCKSITELFGNLENFKDIALKK